MSRKDLGREWDLSRERARLRSGGLKEKWELDVEVRV